MVEGRRICSSYADKECDALLKIGFQYHRMGYYLLLAYEYRSFQIFIDPLVLEKILR